MGQPRLKRERAPVLEEGFWLDDDLRVVNHLGGSHKVDVYLCRSRRLRKRVTCKVLRPEYCVDFASLEAVAEEGEYLLRLRHPSVVEGYGVELEDHPRIIMQYLPGQTTAGAFLSGNFEAYAVLDVVKVAEDVSNALTYVHGQGLLHLDVKPSNVMYHNGLCTLFDFSVAQEYTPDRPLRDNAGTVEYMSPEQTYKEELGFGTDVFGLGALFYQLLTGGQLPYAVTEWQDPNDTAETKRQLDYATPPPDPSVFNPRVPRALSAVALRALNPIRAERFGTAQDFNDALTDAARE